MKELFRKFAQGGFDPRRIIMGLYPGRRNHCRVGRLGSYVSLFRYVAVGH